MPGQASARLAREVVAAHASREHQHPGPMPRSRNGRLRALRTVRSMQLRSRRAVGAVAHESPSWRPMAPGAHTVHRLVHCRA
jgi:hypothetical protein